MRRAAAVGRAEATESAMPGHATGSAMLGQAEAASCFATSLSWVVTAEAASSPGVEVSEVSTVELGAAAAAAADAAMLAAPRPAPSSPAASPSSLPKGDGEEARQVHGLAAGKRRRRGAAAADPHAALMSWGGPRMGPWAGLRTQVRGGPR